MSTTDCLLQSLPSADLLNIPHRLRYILLHTGSERDDIRDESCSHQVCKRDTHSGNPCRVPTHVERFPPVQRSKKNASSSLGLGGEGTKCSEVLTKSVGVSRTKLYIFAINY